MHPTGHPDRESTARFNLVSPARKCCFSWTLAPKSMVFNSTWVMVIIPVLDTTVLHLLTAICRKIGIGYVMWGHGRISISAVAKVCCVFLFQFLFFENLCLWSCRRSILFCQKVDENVLCFIFSKHRTTLELMVDWEWSCSKCDIWNERKRWQTLLCLFQCSAQRHMFLLWSSPLCSI